MILKLFSPIFCVLLILLSIVGHTSHFQVDESQIITKIGPEIEVYPLASQYKRKRLIQYFSPKKTKTKHYRKSQGATCEICNKKDAAERYIIAQDEPKIWLRVCMKCYIKCVYPQIEDRIFISRPGNQYQIGDIVDINEDESFKVKLLDGATKGQVQNLNENDFHKVIPEMIPSKELCPICDRVRFNAQKCFRNQCIRNVCHLCHTKTEACEYCKLFHRGTLIKVKYNKLGDESKKRLKDIFGENFTEVYGKIDDIISNSEKTHYEVLLSKNYEWPLDQNGTKTGDIELNAPIEQTYLLTNDGVEVLHPPPADDGFNIHEFLNAELDELQTQTGFFSSNHVQHQLGLGNHHFHINWNEEDEESEDDEAQQQPYGISLDEESETEEEDEVHQQPQQTGFSQNRFGIHRFGINEENEDTEMSEDEEEQPQQQIQNVVERENDEEGYRGDDEENQSNLNQIDYNLNQIDYNAQISDEEDYQAFAAYLNQALTDDNLGIQNTPQEEEEEDQ